MYNLRTNSLRDVNLHAKLDAELAARGAKTFGSTKRKQERLQRFLDLEARSTDRSKFNDTEKKFLESIDIVMGKMPYHNTTPDDRARALQFILATLA